MKSKNAAPENFGKYGKIVKAPQGKPTSEAADYKFWSDIANYKIDGNTEVGICTVYKQDENIITGMERHLHTPEILIPIDAPFVLPVMLDDEDSAEAFKIEIGEAIIINNAVWHGACLPVGKNESSYFVIFRHRTPQEDVEKKTVSPFKIEIEN